MNKPYISSISFSKPGHHTISLPKDFILDVQSEILEAPLAGQEMEQLLESPRYPSITDYSRNKPSFVLMNGCSIRITDCSIINSISIFKSEGA